MIVGWMDAKFIFLTYVTLPHDKFILVVTIDWFSRVVVTYLGFQMCTITLQFMYMSCIAWLHFSVFDLNTF